MSQPQQPLQDDKLLVQHEQFLGQAKEILQKELADGEQQYKPFFMLIAHRLEVHAQWLSSKNRDEPPSLWGPITVDCESTNEDNGPIVVHIVGPGKEPVTLVTVDGQEEVSALENKIREYDYMSKVLERAMTQAFCILKHHMSSSIPSGGKATQTHIALLKQYNDVRDVSQQLIGIIADNRGVPVGSLYKDGTYGVGMDD